MRDNIPIEFEANGIQRNEIRKSSLFQEYFDKIWRELQNDDTKS